MTLRRLFFVLSANLAAQLLLLPEKCTCYLIDPRIQPQRNGRRGETVRWLSSSSSSSPAENEHNEVSQKKRNRPAYTRSPDYPSFAYDDEISGANGRRPTRRVSIDSGRKEEIYGGDETSKALFGMLTPPSSALEFDFLVSGIRDSNRRTRLLNRRSYTAREPFLQKNINEPPCLQDLKAPPSPYIDVLWFSIPFRVLSFAIPYYLFPYLIGFLDNYVTMKPEQLSEITEKFAPGVSILYGTFISLTLGILYQRQRDIQNDVAVEASLLALVTRKLLRLFRSDPSLSVEAGQTCADQIRILAKGSRGSELLAIMYSDPYARMLEIIEDREITLMDERDNGDLGGDAAAIGSCRQILEDLFKIRADRLSDESLALPPTHFLIMTILTLFILLGYVINVLPTVDASTGNPSNESAVIFSLLSTVYILFYNFAQDLNNPFSGLYQIRRSSTAAHLLQAKWLLVNNPLTRGRIDFDEPPNRVDDVLIRTPGIGDVLFARDEIYPDMMIDNNNNNNSNANTAAAAAAPPLASKNNKNNNHGASSSDEAS
eukprot:CAMPEP_0172389468 /NCGR_PEP_ID=MMETSP1061-20121228/6356_1 /TAXON_ID=37318 /ORGANISM="Pseudo-nitzschia pungens, Strain cf. pungens" /LENGTH=543 /DNA_ID=CAMNT_0013119637 /DNA_START=11 /DNA_END=1642 /DNA_ORIENTATION=+